MPLDPEIAHVPYASENPVQEPAQTNITYLPAEPVDQGPAVEQGGPAPVEFAPGTPTLAEIREYNQANGIVNPILDLNAQEISELAENDPDHFNLEQSLIKLQPHWDKELIDKSAEAWNLLERRGWKPAKDLGASKLPGMLVDTVKGTASWLTSLAKGAVGIPAALAMEKIDIMMGLPPSPAAITTRQKLEQEISETAGATEANVTGLAFLGEKGYNKLFGKKPELKTHEEKIASLKAALIPHLAQKKIAEGGGLVQYSPEVQEELKQAGLATRPEEVEKKIAGDPLGFVFFGKGLEGVAGAFGLAKGAVRGAAKLPGIAPVVEKVSATVGPAAKKVVDFIPSAEQVGGKVVETTGKAVSAVGKTIEKTAPVTGSAAALGTAVAAGHALTPLTIGQLIVGGILGEASGLTRLASRGVRLTKGLGQKVAGAGEAITTAGKEIAGKELPTGAITQGVKDVLQSIPDSAGHVGKGAVLDLGLAALTSTTPEDQQGLQLGTLLGGLQAARGTAAWVVSGQKIAPRAWGSKNAVASSKQFPTFDAMHDAAYSKATPAERQRINAVREFVKGVTGDADVYMADPTLRDSRGVNTAIEKALIDSGYSPADAALYAAQDGMFIKELPDKSGNPRRVVVLAKSDAAPHEAKHAFQDVIGEEANQVIDKVIRETYADQWEQIGTEYTEKLIGRKLRQGESWRDHILDKTGDGDYFAQRQLALDEANKFTADTGAAPQPGQFPQMPPIRRGAWRDILAPEDAGRVADRYITREIAAENFDAIFKNLGGSLKEQTGVLPWLARVVASTTEMLGGDALQGRKSDLGIPLQEPVIEAIKGEVRGFTPEVAPKAAEPAKPTIRPTPAAPLPSGSPAPITPADREAVAEETRAIAAEASDVPKAAGLRSDRELLGEIALAQATGDAVKLNYLSAPEEPAAAISSNRKIRREMIELFRSMPQAARRLWEKNFFPERVRRTGKGKIQVGGWAPEVFAANAHKTAQTLSKLDPSLSPYELDPATNSFSEKGWRELFSDVQTFVRNQMAGRTGSGEELVVPKNLTDAGFFKPPLETGAGGLDQTKADFISAMFGMKLPETARMTEGRFPLNIAGQEVSAATIPGRVEPAVRPRGTYEKAPVEGRDIAEVNPWRAEFERAVNAAGAELPSTIEAFQWLNLENIKEVQGSPEQPQFRGNTLTLQAGFKPGEAQFKPSTEKKEIEAIGPDGKSYKVRFDGYWDLSSLGRGQVPAITALEDLPGSLTKLSSGMSTSLEKAGYKLVGLPEPETTAQFKPREGEEDVRLGRTFDDYIGGVKAAILEGQPDLAKGFLEKAASAANFQRTLARKGDVSEFGDPKIDEEFESQTKQIKSLQKELAEAKKEQNIFLDADLPIKVWEAGGKLKETPEFHSMEGTGFNSFAELTEAAMEGDLVKFQNNPGFWGLARIYGDRAIPRREEWRLAAKLADSGAKMSDIRDVAERLVRDFSERNSKPGATYPVDDFAINFSTKTLVEKIQELELMKNAIRIKNGYFGKRAPFSQPLKPKRGILKAKPEELKEGVQFRPKSSKEVQEVAEKYAKSVGRSVAPAGHVKYPRETAKKLAKFYEEAKHNPDDPEVQASYAAFKQETLDQWKEIEAAGYDLEPILSVESPYRNVLDVAKDVEDNKHLFFNLTESSPFLEPKEGPKKNLLLEPSGIVVGGKELNYNDVFRAVHDFFGHAKEGFNFGPRGEFNAWREHSSLYSEEAQGALAAETIGQTAWTQLKPELLGPTGELLKPGEEGFVPRRDRPYAEQKNIVVPKDLIEEAKGQFKPKKGKKQDELKFVPTSFDAASKAWILPNGKVEQLGAEWHHQWLDENPEVQKKYGLKIPPFEGTDTEGVREQTLRKGFARVNLDNATLVVEARERDWKNIRPIVEDMIERNLDDIDKFRVQLLDDGVKRITRSFSEKLFDADSDKEKLSRVFSAFSEQPQAEIGREAQFKPGDEGEDIRGAIGHVYPRSLDVVGKQGRLSSLSHTKLPREDAGQPISWRYSDKYNTVFWWEVPNADQKQAVTDWLKTKGFDPQAHEYMHPGMTKEFYDTAHGQFKPKQSDFENPESLKETLSKPGWAIVTATQESVGPWNDPKNVAANKKLAADLTEKGYEHFPVSGTYKGEPQGENFVVLGISPTDAQILGKKYGQESVLTSRGLLYGDGTITPARPEDTITGPKAAEQDFYSTTPEGLDFSIPLDFDKPYKAVGEQEQLFGGREYVSPASLSRQELLDRYPEAIVPKNSNEKIPSDVVGSPLYRKSENPVRAFADKLVEFAKQHTDNPVYQLGLKWYSDFVPLLKKHFGKDAPMMAELLAASSPNETPTQNFFYAVDALEGFKSGRFDKTIEKFNQGFDMFKEDKWQAWYNKELKAGNIPNPPQNPTPEAFLAHWIYKHGLKPKQSNGALYGFHGKAILEVMARKWLEQNKGPKVANFVQNLLGTGREATIDVWADRTMRRIGYEGAKDRWRILPKNGEGVSDADFEFAQKAFREAAKDLGITPDALQGGLWFAEKKLWADNGWGRLDLGSYVNEIENLPIIRQSIKQRLKTTELKKKAVPMEQGGLEFDIGPRKLK